MGKPQGWTKPIAIRSQDNPVNSLVCCRQSAGSQQSGESGLLIAPWWTRSLPSVSIARPVVTPTVLGSLAEG